MDPPLWIFVVITLVLGSGMFLLVPGERLLAKRAEALGMWPDRKDVPRRPWAIWPEWTFPLWADLLRSTDQRDREYRRCQNRVRLGAILTFAGFAVAGLVGVLS
jgi:hypothetical protein